MGYFIAGLLLLSGPALAVRIASLSRHDPLAWTEACADGILCNLRVYEAAAAAAADLRADAILFPEAYALAPISGIFEPFVSPVGAKPCGSANTSSPQQEALACMAARHGLLVSANVFTVLGNGSKRIMEVVYDPKGAVVTSYSKYKLMPIFETLYASAGPFLPTVFDFAGIRWGILICYEGVYPFTPWGSWRQIQSLKAQGAEALLWSIGAMVPYYGSISRRLARRYGVSVVASQNYAEGLAADATGSMLLTTSSAPLAVDGYTANATVVVMDVPSPQEQVDGYTANATVVAVDVPPPGSRMQTGDLLRGR